jgi:hypothetical protein
MEKDKAETSLLDLTILSPRPHMIKTVLKLAFLALLLSACAAPFVAQTCADQSKEALTTIQSIAREWDDANKLAGQTPRSALSGQIATLQAVRRKVQDVVVPECAAPMKQALVESMDASIEGYVAFLGQKSDSVVQASFKTANEKMNVFAGEVVKLSAAP